eukprot:TRINITY_DN99378_c0_g1_i1.p2 TRINITY_DN99378_c0_g1~~TRINITY_DN99378_c0_g1_i1.p2  ORF type:complete len:130 (+),score=12.85 TRINITY_DN99378_c0_g1_i1:53-442(+)
MISDYTSYANPYSRYVTHAPEGSPVTAAYPSSPYCRSVSYNYPVRIDYPVPATPTFVPPAAPPQPVQTYVPPPLPPVEYTPAPIYLEGVAALEAAVRELQRTVREVDHEIADVSRYAKLQPLGYLRAIP